MQLNGSRVIHASRTELWALLNEPAKLQPFIPGCESVTARDDGLEHEAVVTARIGPVSARFKGTLTLEAQEAPSQFRLRFQGQGGAAGFASGGATVRLEEQGHATLLSYSVEARIGGKLAQVGSRLVEATAAKLADEFFDRMGAHFIPGEPVAAPAAMPEPAWVQASGSDGGHRAGRHWLVLTTALALGAALLWSLARAL